MLAVALFWVGLKHPALDLAGARGIVTVTAPRVVVQTILFPHVGYKQNLRPFLSPDDLLAKPGDVYLLAPDLDSWPFEYDAPRGFSTRLAACGQRTIDPSGLETITIETVCDAR